jgi:hypothetical protein
MAQLSALLFGGRCGFCRQLLFGLLLLQMLLPLPQTMPLPLPRWLPLPLFLRP